MEYWNQQKVMAYIREMNAWGHHATQQYTEEKGWLYYCPFCEATFDPDETAVEGCPKNTQKPLFRFVHHSAPFGYTIISEEIMDADELVTWCTTGRYTPGMYLDTDRLEKWLPTAKIGDSAPGWRLHPKLGAFGSYSRLERIK